MPRTKNAPKADEQLSAEHDADPAKAAAAIDAKAKAASAVKEARSAATPEDDEYYKTILRAVELYDSGTGLVKLTRQLTEEGHRSKTGKELRPQTVRQWIMRAKNVDKLGTRTPAK